MRQELIELRGRVKIFKGNWESGFTPFLLGPRMRKFEVTKIRKTF